MIFPSRLFLPIFLIMTILPYLGLLSVGSPLYQQSKPWQLEEDLAILRNQAAAHRRAELQVLGTLNLYSPPSNFSSPKRLKHKRKFIALF